MYNNSSDKRRLHIILTIAAVYAAMLSMFVFAVFLLNVVPTASEAEEADAGSYAQVANMQISEHPSLIELSAARAGSAPSGQRFGKTVVQPDANAWLSQPVTRYVQSTGGVSIYIRYGPSKNYDHFGTIKEREAVKVLARQGDYSYVEASGNRTGWCVSSLLVEKSRLIDSVPTLTDGIWVAYIAGVNHETIWVTFYKDKRCEFVCPDLNEFVSAKYVLSGRRLTIESISQSTQFLWDGEQFKSREKTDLLGEKGYIFLQPESDDYYPEPHPEPVVYPDVWLDQPVTRYVQSTGGVSIYIRYGPSKDYDYFGTVKEREAVKVLARQGDYSYVEASGNRTGWCVSSLLVEKSRLIDPVPTLTGRSWELYTASGRSETCEVTFYSNGTCEFYYPDLNKYETGKYSLSGRRLTINGKQFLWNGTYFKSRSEINYAGEQAVYYLKPF